MTKIGRLDGSIGTAAQAEGRLCLDSRDDGILATELFLRKTLDERKLTRRIPMTLRSRRDSAASCVDRVKSSQVAEEKLCSCTQVCIKAIVVLLQLH